MSGRLIGVVDWSLERDDLGYRTYYIQFLIETTSPGDGPLTAISAPGLPGIGSLWVFVGGEIDANVYCRPECSIRPVLTGEPNTLWLANFSFSNKPQRRCQNSEYENPLLEPYNISGSFVEYTREATLDANNNLLISSSKEPFVGSVVERDDSQLEVNIEWNVSDVSIASVAQYMHKRHNGSIWGLDPGMVKLSNMTFQRLVYGTCFYYFRVKLGFKVDFKKFVRYIPDMGYKKLKDGGSPDNPQDYVICRSTATDDPIFSYLDGSGNPVTSIEDAWVWQVQFYGDANLLELGIPATLNA